MTICLSKEGCQNNNISIAEALLMLAIHNKANLELAKEDLIKKGYITADTSELFHQIGWRLSGKGVEVLSSAIVDSDKKQESDERLIKLATNLKEIFPTGKKEGTNYYWAEGIALIVRRLKLFFKKYGNTYTDEQILKAATTYITSFNGNYTYMRLLKYFIFKEKVGASGEIEGDSELVSYIENAGQENLNNEWLNEIR